jgi:hypothetical protein
LIHIFAEDYIVIGRIFQYWEGVESPSEDTLSDEHYSQYEQHLKDLSSSCQQIGLVTVGKLISASLKSLRRSVSYQQACTRMGQLREYIETDIESRVFRYVPPERADYLVHYEADQFGKKTVPVFGSELARFSKTLESFQSGSFDLEEAGNCFAAGRFTACVHHLSRLVEFGLVSLASYAGVEPNRLLKLLLGDAFATHLQPLDED